MMMMMMALDVKLCMVTGAAMGTPIRDTFGIEHAAGEDISGAEVAGVAIAWNDHAAFYLPATSGTVLHLNLTCPQASELVLQAS